MAQILPADPDMPVVVEDDLMPIDEIMAEPDDPGFFAYIFARTGEIIAGNGWFILGGALAAYYVWKKYGQALLIDKSGSKPVMSDKELKDFQSKEERRLKALEKLQEKYEKEATERAAQLKALEDEKKQARLAELDRLNSQYGTKLGHPPEPSTSAQTSTAKSKSAKKPSGAPSFRPEYNPLMGDTTSRVCFRPSGGRSGG